MPPTTRAKLAVAKDLAKGGAAGKEFSRGIVFSRSRGKVALEDKELLDKATKLKDAEFKKFASRLATLKGIQKGGGK
jgi:hypothetical protein